MTPDDRLDQDLRTLRDSDVPDGPPPKLVARTLTALNREGSRTPHYSFIQRIRTMPTFVQFAAALLLAAGLIFIPFALSPNPRGPGAAFAAVIERVRAARSVTYTMRIGDDPKPCRVFLLEPGLRRTELPDGAVMITDRARGKEIVLSPLGKLVTVIEMQPELEGGPRFDEIDSLRNFRGQPDADLGEKVIDGHPTRGFRFSGGGYNNVVWVDTKTNLPVRMEKKTNVNADGVKTVVLSDFVFDAPLDPALFNTTPPDGSKIQTLPLTKVVAAPVEKDLVDLLGEYAKRSGGRFPNDLQMNSLLDVLKDIKPAKTGFDEVTTAWIARIGQGVGLVWSMPPDSDALYTGKGVQLGQADKPIFRYRPQGSKTYRVIYGDLTVKDIEPGQIPK
jgi:outer membrane lipoprotein-sorting protein